MVTTIKIFMMPMMIDDDDDDHNDDHNCETIGGSDNDDDDTDEHGITLRPLFLKNLKISFLRAKSSSSPSTYKTCSTTNMKLTIKGYMLYMHILTQT